jgi:MinD superfamily P-loop ATPase
MILAVASGKGGTGKTTIAVNLALAIEGDIQFLDCDVEGANSHIFLRPQIERTREVGIPLPVIDEGLCDGCGRCAEACRFNALVRVGKRIRVMPALCHGCEACQITCPKGAVTMISRRLGIVSVGTAGRIAFASGELDVGEAMGVPIIRELKALEGRHEHTIIDCPPGTSCPVVESVHGSDYCLMVTEPTPFGLHDLKLMAKVLERIEVPSGVVVNRDHGPYEQLESFCRNSGIPILMRIPFDRRIAELYSRGEVLVEHIPGFGEKMRALFREISR